MPKARSLADLMRIRAHEPNRKYLETINGTLGTALGFKRRRNEMFSDEPAVLVFVPEKINPKWIPRQLEIKSSLKGPDGLECPLDVICSRRALGKKPAIASESPTAIRLRGFDDRIYCGSQISSSNLEKVEVGTLGAFVYRVSDGAIGFLTNRHVAVGRTVYHPWARGSSIFPQGTTLIGKVDHGTMIEDVSAEEWYGSFAAETGAVVHVDAAFVELDQKHINVDEDILPEPLITGTDIPEGRFGAPLRLNKVDLEKDLVDLNLIGMPVFHVGRTSGLRKGSVWAVSYEWKDTLQQTSYADLLISGENIDEAVGDSEHALFSSSGDSGSVVFTVVKGVKRPVGLLWGGQRQAIRGGSALEHWSYASRLSPILDRLNLKIVTDDIEFH